MSWLRGEDVASVILETASGKDAPPPALNIVNPSSTPWAEIIAFVQRAIIRRKALAEEDLPIVPFEEWFALLERKAENASDEDLAQMVSTRCW